jgi:hypothetical protein
MYGSNSATTEEVEAEMKAAEAKRSMLIGALDLRVVGNDGFAERRLSGTDLRERRR